MAEITHTDQDAALKALMAADIQFYTNAGIKSEYWLASVLEAHRIAHEAPLLARIAELEEVYADAVSGLRYIEKTHGRVSGVGWDRVFDRYRELMARAALATKDTQP